MVCSLPGCCPPAWRRPAGVWGLFCAACIHQLAEVSNCPAKLYSPAEQNAVLRPSLPSAEQDRLAAADSKRIKGVTRQPCWQHGRVASPAQAELGQAQSAAEAVQPCQSHAGYKSTSMSSTHLELGQLCALLLQLGVQLCLARLVQRRLLLHLALACLLCLHDLQPSCHM